MDPLTHGLLGGCLAQAIYRKKVPPAVTVAGALGAMAPDLDVLIHSKANPLLMYEYHRNFTHSLLFIPVGGFLVGLLLWLLWRRRPPLSAMLIAATAGYATHGLLDACTSYGTLLLWPFSMRRISWDAIFIVDPIYSFVLLTGLLLSWRQGRGRAAIAALVITLSYLGLGAFQHHRAVELQARLAESRGQHIEKIRVLPSLGPHLLWRSIYLSEGKLYVDALRVGYDGKGQVWSGGSLPYFAVDGFEKTLLPQSNLAHDLRIFDWFTEGLVARLATTPLELGDLRFSTLPEGLQPLWGIRVDPENPDRHVHRLRFPWTGESPFRAVWEKLKGQASGAQLLSQDNDIKRLMDNPSTARLAPAI